MPAPALVMQTTYAELLERCHASAFQNDFPEDGSFTPKTVKGRRYWYFQAATAQGRAQRYVGQETPELLERIARHREVRNDERERRALVSTLVRSFRLPRLVEEIGGIVEALAQAGVFRLRGVLVGTVAYQTYSAMLGIHLPSGALMTGDVDIAQFSNISIAVGDQTPPMLETLQGIDKTFREIPGIKIDRPATSYKSKDNLRVDFLTPNTGPDTDEPEPLPALRTDAEPLRFLDFLIHEPEPAVLLHGAGVFVLVPSPERYAVHKLIVAGRRATGIAKRDKDLIQAGSLLEALAEKKRTRALQYVWQEAIARGPKWRRLLLEGLLDLKAGSRDTALKALDLSRGTLVGLDLRFNRPAVGFDSTRDVLTFLGEAHGTDVSCAISREALEDHFAGDNLDAEGLVKLFLKNRSLIEGMARKKYLSRPVEEPEAVLIRTTDVELLTK
jgi:hypothetical protein